MQKLCYNPYLMGENHEKKEVIVGIRIAESTKRQLDRIVESEDHGNAHPVAVQSVKSDA